MQRKRRYKTTTVFQHDRL